MPETDLFLILEDIKWQIEEINDFVSNIEKYSDDHIYKAFSHLLEAHYGDDFLDDYGVSLKDYQALVCAGLSNIVTSVTNELSNQRSLLRNLELTSEQIKLTIISLSYLTPLEFLDICDLFNQNVSQTIDFPQSVFIINQDTCELELNPIFKNLFNIEIIDFLKYVINSRLKNRYLDIKELYQEYSSNMNLT